MSTSPEASRTPEMEPLRVTHEYYPVAYGAFCGSWGAKMDMYNSWADGVFTKKGIDLLHQAFPDVEELKVLGVGSGAGEVDCCLLQRLALSFPVILNTVVDPSSEMTSRYNDLVQQKRSSLSGVRCSFVNALVQDFLAELGASETGGQSKKRFHFIHAIHSLYYMDELERAISELYWALEEGGIMLISVMPDDHTLRRLWNRFPFIGSEQTNGPKLNNWKSSDVIEVLNKLDIPFSCFTREWRPDMSACLDPSSDTGNKILDFITHTIHFRDTAPAQLQEDIFSFLRSICPSPQSPEKVDSDAASEECTEHENCIAFIRDFVSIFVQKP
ncbi:histamine N-methyltransferase-like [Diadema setosum]|uniref:histamine N-methyltransferase-like n=1 Tax=Diadema setosum TaxID=31175 RepID=UPI003B3A97DC